MRIALFLVTTALALALIDAATAQSAMPGQTPVLTAIPTQTPVRQTAMPDPNQNVVTSDFGIWPASRAPVSAYGTHRPRPMAPARAPASYPNTGR